MNLLLIAQLVKVLVAGPQPAQAVRIAGGQVNHQYKHVQMVAAQMDRRALARLNRRSNIRVYLDAEVQALDTELQASWGVQRVGGGEAHKIGITGAGINVAIVDTGIDYTHPEFSGRYLGGYDCINFDNDPFDDHHHGTHVAGIVAAADDGVGMVGVAPEAGIYAVKMLNSLGSGSHSTVACAIEWILDHPDIKVANHSYGGSSEPPPELKALFAMAGPLHVAAAGNVGGGPVLWPAKIPNVMAITATDREDILATFSSIGPEVELAAPGVSVYSTRRFGGYETLSGTSMASPHVAGVAALLLSVGETDPRNAMQITAEDFGLVGWDEFYGYGLVSAWKALNLPEPPPVGPDKLKVDAAKTLGVAYVAIRIVKGGVPKPGVFVLATLYNSYTKNNLQLGGLTNNDGWAIILVQGLKANCGYKIKLNDMISIIGGRVPWDGTTPENVGCLGLDY